MRTTVNLLTARVSAILIPALLYMMTLAPLSAAAQERAGSSRSGLIAAASMQQEKLEASDGAANFGSSASLNNNKLVVGAYYSQVGGKLHQGSAYFFSRTGSVWHQQAKLTANDGAADDLFGSAVVIDDNFIIAGVPQKLIGFGNSVDTNQHGAIYVFSIEADDGNPKIEDAGIKGKKLIVSGVNFDSPTEIYVNGQKQKKTFNDDLTPTIKVTAKKAGKLIAPGQTVTIYVRNSNTGIRSNEFMFTRPVD
jgi:FG-GAP repeat